MVTHDASKKWYFACSKYAPLEVGVQLMLKHQCKKLSVVESVNFQFRLSIHSPAMKEHIIEIARCEFLHIYQQIRNTSIERSRGITQPLWHYQPLPKHTAWGAHCCVRNVLFTHKDLIEPVHQIHRWKDGTPCHTIYDDILPWYWCLSRYSGSVQLVEGVYYPPPSCGFRTQKVGELCGEVDTHTWPAAKRSAKNLSIDSTCSRNSGVRATQG